MNQENCVDKCYLRGILAFWFYSQSHIALLFFQVKNIRKTMVDIVTREVSTNDMKEVVNKL